jgi:hypothetical protein
MRSWDDGAGEFKEGEDDTDEKGAFTLISQTGSDGE